MPNSSTVIPVVVAFIALIGTILPVAISQQNNSKQEPRININVIPIENDTRKTIIKLTNYGDKPATNFTMTMDAASKRIMNITERIATSDVFLPQFNNTLLQMGIPYTINRSLLELEIPKLTQGSVSIVELQIVSNVSNILPSNMSRYDFFSTDLMGNPNYDYTFFAVYDQGSIQVNPTMRRTTSEFGDVAANPFELIYFGSFYSVLGGLTYLYIRKRRKRFHLRLLTNIIEIRGLLIADPNNRNVLRDEWKKESDDKRKTTPFSISDYIRRLLIADWNNRNVLNRIVLKDEWKNKSDDKRKTISNIADYIIIEDFYLELAKRNSYILNDSSKLDDIILKKFNQSCLTLANTALKVINWQKYK